VCLPGFSQARLKDTFTQPGQYTASVRAIRASTMAAASNVGEHVGSSLQEALCFLRILLQKWQPGFAFF